MQKHFYRLMRTKLELITLIITVLTSTSIILDDLLIQENNMNLSMSTINTSSNKDVAWRRKKNGKLEYK